MSIIADQTPSTPAPSGGLRLDCPEGDPPALKRLAIDSVRRAVKAYRRAKEWETELRSRQADGRPDRAWRDLGDKSSKDLGTSRRWETWGNLATGMVNDAERRLIEAIATIPSTVNWSATPGRKGHPWQPRAIIMGGYCYVLTVNPDEPAEDPELVVVPVGNFSVIEAVVPAEDVATIGPVEGPRTGLDGTEG